MSINKGRVKEKNQKLGGVEEEQEKKKNEKEKPHPSWIMCDQEKEKKKKKVNKWTPKVKVVPRSLVI